MEFQPRKDGHRLLLQMVRRKGQGRRAKEAGGEVRAAKKKAKAALMKKLRQQYDEQVLATTMEDHAAIQCAEAAKI